MQVADMELTPGDKNECICKVIRESARSVTNAYDKALAPSGLRTTQFTLLTVLARNTVASVTQLSELLGLDQTTTTRNISLLEESGLIARVAHHDPRVKLLKLTTKGKQKRQMALECWQEVQEQIKSSLSEQEWTTFRHVLQKIQTVSKELE
jgi:DNA-binding MarR family transcriptional regulator